MPATTEKQKRFFGAVMGAKKGQKGVSSKAKKVAKEMPKKKIKEFLKTEDNEEEEQSVMKKMKEGGGKAVYDFKASKQRKHFAPPTKEITPKKGAPYNRAKEKRQSFDENTDIINFIECILTKKYASANKYLNNAVEFKLQQKLKQEFNTPLFQSYEEQA